MQLCSKRPVGLGSSSPLLQNRVHFLRPCSRNSRVRASAVFNVSSNFASSYNDQPQQRGALQVRHRSSTVVECASSRLFWPCMHILFVVLCHVRNFSSLLMHLLA